MTKTNESHADASDESKERFSADLDMLKSSFAELRQDVSKLLSNTLGTGKSGAEMLKDRAAVAVDDLKDGIGDGKECVHESFDKLGQKIGQCPLTSAAIALAIGFLLARMLHPKR